jgi:hypothetical protein
MKWNKSALESRLATRSHCVTGVRRATKDVRALMPTRTWGVVCSLRGASSALVGRRSRPCDL